ncbi:MAG: hypothetical protein V7767_15185, partial [Leeuwenhoekiella sp.]
SNPAYISVDGKQVSVNMESAEKSNYSVKLEISDSLQLDMELWHKEGILTISDSTGAVVTRPVYGECGC